MSTLRFVWGDRRQGERRKNDVWQNLYLVRHGESTANEVNRFAGAIDAPLTELGRAQAERAGSHWQGGDIDRVYVSPLIRARQTAEIVLGHLRARSIEPQLVKVDSRISERYFGSFTLKNKTGLQKQFGLRNYETALYNQDASLHGGETFEDFRHRVLNFLKDELYPALCAGEKVLVVAHKYVIELLSRLILRLPEADGFDLRLPNARILSGGEIRRYVQAESRRGNWIRDWIVVRHSLILSAAAVLGLTLNGFGIGWNAPPGLLMALLMVATAISLARISLRNPSALADRRLLSRSQLIQRFLLLPWVVALAGSWLWPSGLHMSENLAAVTLLLAAPTAVTATILSRSAGGMILPTVFVILLSTAMSAANTIALLAWFDMSEVASQAFVFVGLSVSTLLVPMLIAHFMRRRHPISTAKFAEDHGATAVLALALFVVLAFQNLDLRTLYPMGLVALAIGILLRLYSVRISRHGSLYGLDDYFSLSYPNIFLVILLAELVENDPALQLATWFLVPMFVLAPLDDRLILRLQKTQSTFKLRKYLRIHHGGDDAVTGDEPRPYTVHHN